MGKWHKVWSFFLHHDAIGEVIEGALDFRSLFIDQGDQVEIRIFCIDASGARSVEDEFITRFCKPADNLFFNSRTIVLSRSFKALVMLNP